MTTARRSYALRAARWQVDVERSSARFTVRNFGLNLVRGTVPIELAYVDVGESGDVTASHAELDLSRASTGNRHRDADLRKPGLLDSANSPRLVFDAGGAAPSGDGWTMRGRLISRGRTAALVVSARPTGVGSPTRAGVIATATLDRRDLGVRAPRIIIGRRIEIEVHAVLTRGG